MTYRDSRNLLARGALAALVALAVGAGACAGGRPPGGTLAGLVADGAYAATPAGGRPLRFASEPRTGVVKLDDESRPAVTLPAGTWSWRTRVPANGWLQVGVGAVDGGPLEASVALSNGAEREVLEVGRNDPPEDEPEVRGWIDFGADLSRWSGRDVTLEFSARRDGAPGAPPQVAWGPVALAAPREAGEDDPPDVLFILVDTLRHDHLTPYGYRRDTTPEIERRLAERGTVLEDAYSQAPWTLPSVVSFLTSRYPGELLGGDPASFGVPANAETMAAAFAALGYRTGAFIGNPIVHAGNGFAQGFETFYSPASLTAIERHGDSLTRRAVPWLRAHQGERFFAYVHYVDPHDPYEDPDVVGGRSRIFDDPGGMPPTYLQGIYAGKLPIADLDREIAHFTALYDTEVHYVDRAIGELLASLPEEVLAHTLVVLTADHGEELYDHGGWKHGQTLYEDQIHVPLIVRWDGRIPAGKRLAGTVRLVDLLPTLIAAAGGRPAPAWQGEDLLGALEGRSPLPRLEAFAQRLQVGPFRAALVLDGRKLMLYNRTEPFTPADELQAHLYRLNLSRMRGAELYDLRRDPGERHDLLAPAGEEAARVAAALDPPLQAHFARTFQALRALSDSLPAGRRLAGELVFERPAARILPLFLSDEDRAEGRRGAGALRAGRRRPVQGVRDSRRPRRPGRRLAHPRRRAARPRPPAGGRRGPLHRRPGRARRPGERGLPGGARPARPAPLVLRRRLRAGSRSQRRDPQGARSPGVRPMTDASDQPMHPRGALLPPGETAAVHARSVLVLAPHYDDEALGCGGLLAELAAAGARVRVLFLSDGAGGARDAEERRAYAARRREESEAALDALGLADAAYLDLPDGALADHLEDLAEAIGEALVEHGADLVLVPSPLEVTADHRAAFAALHRRLGVLRPAAGGADETLATLARSLTVLVYEVNHPAYPDLLVDVSGRLAAVRAAMACYASQQERHDYLAAGLGLRRYRTLSLAAGVEAAEGYRRLALADFTTRSPAQLVRHLGGVPELLAVTSGPRVSVVVRTKDRPAFLAQALDSLAAGTYRRVEVVVVNDGGRPPELPEDYPLTLRRVDLPENRGRAAAANAGVEAASGDWIAFLDDDDLAAPEHLAVLVDAAAGAGVRAVYCDAAVVTYELTGAAEPGAPGGWRPVERRLPYSRDFDPDLLVLDNYIPFNTVLLERSLVGELAAAARAQGGEGPFDPELPFFEDWDFLIRLAARQPLHHVRRTTCEYRHFRGAGHHALGDRPRERPDFLAMKARVLARHAELLAPERLARAVDTLRSEAVGLAEELSRVRSGSTAELDAFARRHRELEERFHAVRGEAEALRGQGEALAAEVARAGAELERLYPRESELQRTVDDQTEHLGRTYAEIERLNGLLRQLGEASLARPLPLVAGAAQMKLGLVSSEPLEGRVAGIGIRYLEMARRLPALGVETVAVSPADPEATPLPAGGARRFVAGRLPEILADCQAVLAQGQLANDVVLECPHLPVAIDLYDPWLVENLHYTGELGLDPYRNDHATWVLQLSRGDFFLCSSEEQRLYYLGFLTALGRVNPHRLATDPDLAGLIAPVPFGVPEELPAHRPVLEPAAAGERRLLFGALYEWYDPWTVLEALAELERSGGPVAGIRWTLLFVRHPRPEATPQRLLGEVEARCRERGWWGSRVKLVDWVPFERRYDLLRDVDLLVAPHRPSLETRLSMRTRLLDALAAGCPVVTSEGGTLSRLLAEHDAGWVCPAGDPAALAAALGHALAHPDAHAAGAERLAGRFAWPRVLEPLVAFCRTPRRDPTRDDFAFRPETVAPPDGLAFRLRRLLRPKS